jgi:hypothetical protein
VRARHRLRRAINLANGSTLAGLGVALAGRARLAGVWDGLLVGTGYRLPVPPAPAFTLGSVIITRRDALAVDSDLFRHEARHATQYAWCGGLLMIPLYFAAAGASWMLCGDFGPWNVFERRAGLAGGGYADRPLRPVFQRWSAGTPRPSRPRRSGQTARPAAGPGDRGPGPEPAAPAGSTATPSR